MGKNLYAGAFSNDGSITDDGTEKPIPLNADAFGDQTYWVDVSPFSELTIEFEADQTANGNTCSFTVEALVTQNSTAYDLATVAALASATVDRTTVSSTDITMVSFVRVLADGTSGDTQFAGLLAK